MSLENTRALAEMLGLVPANQATRGITESITTEPEAIKAAVDEELSGAPGAPDFDGGVREPAPGPSDPEAEHNEFLIDLLGNLPTGGGGKW